MPEKQHWKIRVIYKGQTIREVKANSWNAKERIVEDLTKLHPKAQIDAEQIPQKVKNKVPSA